MIDDRVFVTLNRDARGYPPWDEEEVWATRISADTFRLEASPTFARGLSYQDLAHVVPVGDRWYVESVVASGKHSTIRVILFRDDALDRLIDAARRNGCTIDHTEIPALFAIDVPPTRPLDGLIAALAEGSSEGRWDYEDGNLAEGHAVG